MLQQNAHAAGVYQQCVWLSRQCSHRVDGGERLSGTVRDQLALRAHFKRGGRSNGRWLRAICAHKKLTDDGADLERTDLLNARRLAARYNFETIRASVSCGRAHRLHTRNPVAPRERLCVGMRAERHKKSRHFRERGAYGKYAFSALSEHLHGTGHNPLAIFATGVFHPQCADFADAYSVV